MAPALAPGQIKLIGPGTIKSPRGLENLICLSGLGWIKDISFLAEGVICGIIGNTKSNLLPDGK